MLDKKSFIMLEPQSATIIYRELKSSDLTGRKREEELEAFRELPCRVSKELGLRLHG